MVDTTALASPAVLTTTRVRLVPLGLQNLDSMMTGLEHEEFMRLTGTPGSVTREHVGRFLVGIGEADDRAERAMVRASDGLYLGQVVLDDLDMHNRSMNF